VSRHKKGLVDGCTSRLGQARIRAEPLPFSPLYLAVYLRHSIRLIQTRTALAQGA
jgi:hypothetical protein